MLLSWIYNKINIQGQGQCLIDFPVVFPILRDKC